MELSGFILHLDQFALAISGPVLAWILLSGVDDLFIYYALFLSRFQKRPRPPTLEELKAGRILGRVVLDLETEAA